MLQDISTQAKYHWQAEESLANTMGWSTTDLHQPGPELYRKTLSLCERGADTLNTSSNKLCRVLNCLQAVTVWNVKFLCFIWFQYKHYCIMKIVIFIVIVLCGSVVVKLRCGGYIVYCWIQRNVRIERLQEFLKSDHWLRRYCILSGGVFYFEPPCTCKN